jgi:hypothetical protein
MPTGVIRYQHCGGMHFLTFTLRRGERPFWQARYDDFNVWTDARRIEKLRSMHRNPVKRGLVGKSEDWVWSSNRHDATEIEGPVQIESHWTAGRREHGNTLPGPKIPGTPKGGGHLPGFDSTPVNWIGNAL